jgi:hypothetical protein
MVTFLQLCPSVRLGSFCFLCSSRESYSNAGRVFDEPAAGVEESQAGSSITWVNFRARSGGPSDHGASMSRLTSPGWRRRRRRAGDARGARQSERPTSVPAEFRVYSLSALCSLFLGRWDGERYEECGSVFCRPEHSLQRLSRNERPSVPPSDSHLRIEFGTLGRDAGRRAFSPSLVSRVPIPG